MMKKLESCKRQNELKMAHLNETIADSKKSLVKQLRMVADYIEADETRRVDRLEVSWINKYVAEIEEAEAKLKILHEEQMMLEYIAEAE